MRDAVAATGLEFKELGACEAVNRGCLSAVQRRQRGGRLSFRQPLCMYAAGSGQLEVLQWLPANDCPWDKYTCAHAAGGGHLEVLQWLRANDCPWDEDMCEGAAEGGHLEVLQWAHANGCPWSEEELYMAAKKGHEMIVRFLIEAQADVDKALDTNTGEYG